MTATSSRSFQVCSFSPRHYLLRLVQLCLTLRKWTELMFSAQWSASEVTRKRPIFFKDSFTRDVHTQKTKKTPIKPKEGEHIVETGPDGNSPSFPKCTLSQISIWFSWFGDRDLLLLKHNRSLRKENHRKREEEGQLFISLGWTSWDMVCGVPWYVSSLCVF